MQNKSKNQKVLELLLDAEYFKAVVGNITETKIADFVNGFKLIVNCLPEDQRTNAVLILLGKTEEFNSTSRHKTVDGREVICEVTDRGPAKRLVKKGRIIDLSKRAFSEIANLEQGLVEVQIEEVKEAR